MGWGSLRISKFRPPMTVTEIANFFRELRALRGSNAFWIETNPAYTLNPVSFNP